MWNNNKALGFPYNLFENEFQQAQGYPYNSTTFTCLHYNTLSWTREHGGATIPVRDYHLTWVSLWNNGCRFAQTYLPSQRSSSLGLKFAVVHTNGGEGRTGQRGFSVFWCLVSFSGTERTLFYYIREGSLFTRSRLKPSPNWIWKNILSNSASLFSSQKISL